MTLLSLSQKGGSVLRRSLVLASAILLSQFALAVPNAPYSEEAAGDPSVLALWPFAPETPESDLSSYGHHLQLRGADTRWVADGRFQGALEIVREKEPGDDRAQGAFLPHTPELSPPGAFTLELWAQMTQTPAARSVLVDKKYFFGTSERPGANSDYQLQLIRIGQSDRYTLEAQLGFGNESEIVRSQEFPLRVGEWNHFAFSYSGDGLCRFYFNGEPVGEKKLEGRAGLHPGTRGVVIGDRAGDRHARFVGKISEVRLSGKALTFSPVQGVRLRHHRPRTAFYKNEKGAAFQLEITHHATEALPASLLRLHGPGPQEREIKVPALQPQESRVLTLPWNASLKPGRYPVTITSVDAEGKPLANPLKLEVTLLPRPLPGELPVIMWGHARGERVEQLAALGFTHYIGLWQGSSSPVPEFMTPAHLEQVRREMDQSFASGIRSVGRISIGHARKYVAEHPRKNRNGEPIAALNALLPEVRTTARELGDFVRREFDDLTPLEGILIDTEVRDHTHPSFDQVDREAYRQATGKEIPPLGRDLARGVSYQQLPNFPPRRVVEEDHPILQYYRWFWKEGDGWNDLHSLTAAPLREQGRFWTWHDPAVRAPSIYGSGGKVDFLSQWTYTYPDPLKIELASNDLVTMAEGSAGAKPMKMTQVIWYRSQTAPLPRPNAPAPRNRAAWEEEYPDARFLTIAPDHLSEALWLKLSQPVQGLMYHGLGSLLASTQSGTPSATSYTATHPGAETRFGEMIRDVVRPLGPLFGKLPAAPHRVGYLQSFTAQMFAERGTYGWGNGWGADAYLIARYAGLEPKVLYDETVLQGDTDGYALLFLIHCDVLSRGVVERLRAFQDRGGLIVGDEFLCPEIQPDVLLPSYRRRNIADQDKGELLTRAEGLKQELAPYYHETARSNEPDLLLRQRGPGKNYLVAVNDHRTYGDYLGAHRLVMEEGVELKAEVTWDHPGAIVYDLMKKTRLPVQPAKGGVRFPLELDAGEGTLLVALRSPLQKVVIHPPKKAIAAGGSGEVVVDVLDATGKSAPALLPVEVTIRDPKGEVAEQSGFYTTQEGQLRLRLEPASNDLPGEWHLEAKEGASGLEAKATFRVE